MSIEASEALRPADDFPGLMAQILRELTKLEAGDTSHPKYHEGYLLEMISIMNYRLSQGDLSAPTELKVLLDQLFPFIRRNYKDDVAASNLVCYTAAVLCAFVHRSARVAEQTLSYVSTIDKYKKNPERFVREGKILKMLSTDGSYARDAICEMLRQETPGLNPEYVGHILGIMHEDGLLHSTIYERERRDDEEGFTDEELADGAFYGGFLYCLSPKGKDLLERLNKKE